MIKEAWVSPETKVQQFMANEYVAACGVKDGKYIFTCDAPRGVVYYYDKSSGAKKRLGGYRPCWDKHITNGPDGYYDGFVDYNGNGQEDDGEGVLVWIEWGWFSAADWHASASLTRELIDVERS